MLLAVFLVAPLCVLHFVLIEYTVIAYGVVNSLNSPESEIKYLGFKEIAYELYSFLGIFAAYGYTYACGAVEGDAVTVSSSCMPARQVSPGRQQSPGMWPRRS